MVVTLIALSACGGGGDGGSSPALRPTLDVATLKADGCYINVHTALCPNGEIRGQIDVDPAAVGQQANTIPLTSTAEVTL